MFVFCFALDLFYCACDLSPAGVIVIPIIECAISYFVCVFMSLNP